MRERSLLLAEGERLRAEARARLGAEARARLGAEARARPGAGAASERVARPGAGAAFEGLARPDAGAAFGGLAGPAFGGLAGAAFERLAQRYRELLPEVVVARCPFTDAPVRWPIDTAGLDGWFWEYPSGARRDPRELPPSWVAMTGAMRLVQPVEHAPFAAVPGPGAPFVVPRILGAAPEVRGVIAQVAVGRHTGWAISYFGRPAAGTRLVNLWGTGSYPVVEDGLCTGWGREEPEVARYDFDLEPWVGTGALLWIAPGDESATLRQGVDGCPYLDLPGPHQLAVVERGQVRYAARLG